ncbi:MAG TPA: DUF1501 domain-containing protein, partial [Planctomycetaceae bacterium]|nr:DUF1501 domain-containing protein [Planctomycetaceae bacterium]
MRHSRSSASRITASMCPGPVSRRSILEAGSLGLGMLGLGDVLKLRAEQPAAGSGVGAGAAETAVIFIWLPGGPPHMEMYDMKPEAPAEYRGLFSPIATNVSGLDVCELLPLHAKCADRYNIIRSVAHEFADHGGGHKRFLTGRLPATPTGFVNDAPAVGSIVARCRERVATGLPNYISGTEPGRAGVDVYSFGAAWLGPSYVPFNVPGDPGEAGFTVRNLSVDKVASSRLEDRVQLLQGFDRLRRGIDESGVMQAMDQVNRQGVSMLDRDAARTAFDLAQEPA